MYLSTCLSASLKTKLFCETSCLNLTTSKTQQYCETSSIFELDNVKNKGMLRDFLNFRSWQHQKRTNSVRFPSIMESWMQVPMRFAIFPLHVSKVLHLPRKSEARSYEVLHLSHKIISANLKIWCSKMQPLSGNQRPDLLTSLMNMSLVLRLPRKMHLCRSSSHVWRKLTFCSLLAWCRILCACHTKRRLNVQKWREHVLWAFSLRNVLRTTMACTFCASQLPKVLRS